MNFDLKGLLAFTLLLAIPASATDGYFSTGYGIKQQGQGGAGIAFPEDSLAAATNPPPAWFWLGTVLILG
jgi:hypothetical protein